ncbi:hypothetical protein C1H46_038382 [Malus baccata]|uniref:Uncharacterized protein n=1 Tax=Malus baccata TaxID=106549 RepID=A0A540KPD2_MALBA|nr:hypothetical protein C1H46_038382 [Malus baccata]
MTTYNLDPDVVRWGLHLLDVCTMSNDNSHSTVTQYDQDFSQVECVREGYVEPCNVENDEIIAQAYQEELSRLTSVEKSGGSGYGDGQLEASILAQDWLGPSNRHNGTGLENVRDAVNYFGRNMDTDDYRNKQHEAHDPRRIGNEVANDHCEGEYSINGEDFLHLLDITDESSLDGEVGRRLNQMASVPDDWNGQRFWLHLTLVSIIFSSPTTRPKDELPKPNLNGDRAIPLTNARVSNHHGAGSFPSVSGSHFKKRAGLKMFGMQ